MFYLICKLKIYFLIKKFFNVLQKYPEVQKKKTKIKLNIVTLQIYILLKYTLNKRF